MKRTKTIILSVLWALFILAAVMICTELILDKNDTDTFNELATMTVESDTPENAGDNAENPSTEAPITADMQTPVMDIPLLKSQNSDCVGWINILNSKINYPVMLTVEEPEKYLHKNFKGSYSKSGVPFIDSRCNLANSNIIIYGHNMRNGSMFGELKNYLKADYRKTHETITLQTENALISFKVIDVKLTDVTDSIFEELTVTDRRKIILSTCYGNDADDRLLVIAEEI